VPLDEVLEAIETGLHESGELVDGWRARRIDAAQDGEKSAP
jgi:hypothetical protein